jgi:hypothetical protein
VHRPNADKAVKDLRTVTHTAGLTTRQSGQSPRAEKELNGQKRKRNIGKQNTISVYKQKEKTGGKNKCGFAFTVL